MRGQNALEKLRIAGYKPARVFVTVLAGEPRSGGFLDAEESLSLGSIPELAVGGSDIIGTLDFRPLVGLEVVVNGIGKRVVDVCRRIVEFQPNRVIACDGEKVWDKRL